MIKLKNRIIFYSIYFIVLFFPLLFSENKSASVLFYNYLLQLLFILIYIRLDGNKLRLFASPAIIALLYINTNFLIGSWAFNNHFISNKEWLTGYLQLSNLRTITLYFNLTNLIILFSQEFNLNMHVRKSNLLPRLSFNSLNLILWVIILFLLSRTTINFNIIGGKGDFTIIPKSILALLIIVFIHKKGGKYRFIHYAILLLFFVSFSYHSKREVIFLVFPIALLEVYNKRFKYKLIYIFYAAIPLFIILYLIVVMSITRGYGGFNTDGVLESTNYVGKYLKDKKFISYFMNNIEVSSTTYNSTKAIDIILENPHLMTYGESIIKFLFIPVPRQLFPNKPNSMVDIYTKSTAPEFRKIGGSFPISLQSEAFWNFHFFGLLFLLLFFAIVNLFFTKLIKSISQPPSDRLIILLYAYTIFLYIIRGNGIDVFILYLIIGIVSYYFIKIISLILNRLLIKNV